MTKLIIDHEFITARNYMDIGLPGDVDLEAAITAGAVNVKAEPLDWQNAIAEHEGSLRQCQRKLGCEGQGGDLARGC